MPKNRRRRDRRRRSNDNDKASDGTVSDDSSSTNGSSTTSASNVAAVAVPLTSASSASGTGNKQMDILVNMITDMSSRMATKEDVTGLKDDLNEIKRHVDQVNDDMKGVKSKLGMVDSKLGYLVEANLRLALEKKHGRDFVRRFSINGLEGIVRILCAKPESRGSETAYKQTVSKVKELVRHIQDPCVVMECAHYFVDGSFDEKETDISAFSTKLQSFIDDPNSPGDKKDIATRLQSWAKCLSRRISDDKKLTKLDSGLGLLLLSSRSPILRTERPVYQFELDLRGGMQTVGSTMILHFGEIKSTLNEEAQDKARDQARKAFAIFSTAHPLLFPHTQLDVVIDIFYLIRDHSSPTKQLYHNERADNNLFITEHVEHFVE